MGLKNRFQNHEVLKGFIGLATTSNSIFII